MEASVLDPVRHERLIEDLDHICGQSNVPRKYIQQSMKLVCDATEIDYVVNFRLYRGTYPGLVIEGKANSEERCMSIAGALLRNFIDARVVTLSTLLDAAEGGTVPDPTVMLIPNLYVSSYGKTLPAWKVNAVYDLLLRRWTSEKPTVVVVESLKGLAAAYGQAFYSHLSNYKD